MRGSRPAAILGLSFIAMVAPGCIWPECPATHVSIDQLLSEYNANAAAVPRLWARAKIAVTLADEKGRKFTWGSTSRLASPNGLLLLFKGAKRLGPHDFVLVGREVAGMELFRIGSSTEQGVYYFWYSFGENAGAWWGRHAYAGAPGIAALPIDPNQLLAVLGICEMPDDLTSLPGVALSMSKKPCAYVLTCFDRQAVTGRIGFRREVYFHWHDKKLRRPFMVNFFAGDGRRVMTARLKDYKPVKAAGDAPPETAAVMPTNIEIEAIDWPGREEHNPVRRIHIVLSDMTTEEKGSREACSFRPPAGKAIQVDEGVERLGLSPVEGPALSPVEGGGRRN